MSLNAITNGVTPTTQVVEGAPVVVLPTQETLTLGRTYGEYDESYARLRVFSSSRNHRILQNLFPTDSNPTSPVPTSARAQVASSTTTFEIDYILLQSLSEVFVERMAPAYTFGAAMIQSSGSDAKQFIYMGLIVPNPLDGDNRTRFTQSYTDALRVSQLVTKTHHRYVELYYRNQIRRGYLTSLGINTSADIPNRAEITFSMFVTDVLYEHQDSSATAPASSNNDPT